jgi:hypothetical protein
MWSLEVGGSSPNLEPIATFLREMGFEGHLEQRGSLVVIHLGMAHRARLLSDSQLRIRLIQLAQSAGFFKVALGIDKVKENVILYSYKVV